MADPGEGFGGPAPPLCLDQTQAPRAEKIFLGDGPPPLSKGLDNRAPSLYLRVWITEPPPLYLRVWITEPPPPLSKGLDNRAPPLYLRVWITEPPPYLRVWITELPPLYLRV